MKKSIILSLFLAGLLVLPGKAQDHKSTICLNGGVSLVGNLISAGANVTGSSTTAGLPAIQVTYDYSAAEWFSIGAAVSYQVMNVKYSDWGYYDANNNYTTGDFKTSLSRLNVAARALFHYGGLEKIDMYSGLRMGYTNWSYSTDSPDPTYDAASIFSGGTIAPQLILYGIRAYFTDNFGINAELAIGPPSYFSAGINYRF